MADELKLRREADRAARAQALLDDDLLKEAFATHENELMTLWEATKADAVSERERIWMAIKTARRVRSALDSIIANGTLATAELNALLGRNAA